MIRLAPSGCQQMIYGTRAEARDYQCPNRRRPGSDYCWNHRNAEIERGLPSGQVVYFLMRGNQVKIGTTQYLLRRLTALQATPADLLAVVRGGHPEEQRLHKLFAPWHARGEWFHATDHFLDLVQEFLQAWPNADLLQAA